MAGKQKRPRGTPASNDYRFNDELARIDWKTFEQVMARWYESQGYDVTHRGTGSGRGRTDGGVDLELRRNGRYLIVQCKHSDAWQTPYNPVVQLHGLVEPEDADGAIFVTSGQFTHEALNKARRIRRMELIDGKALRDMILPYLGWLLRGEAPAPPLPTRPSALAVVPAVAVARAAPSGELAVHRPHLSAPVRSPVVSRASPARRHGLLFAGGVAIVGAIALGVMHLHQPTTSSDVSEPLATAGTVAPAAAPMPARATPAPVRKTPHEKKPVATAMAPIARTRQPAPAGTEPAVVYKSADMSDEEFAAWKARKAERERAPTAQAMEAAPEMQRGDDPSYGTSPVPEDAPTSPETMRTILRTNRR